MEAGYLLVKEGRLVERLDWGFIFADLDIQNTFQVMKLKFVFEFFFYFAELKDKLLWV